MPAEQSHDKSTCKGCGQRIVWGTDEQGALIALDPTPLTYVLTIHEGASRAYRSRAYVSHFAICAHLGMLLPEEKPR